MDLYFNSRVQYCGSFSCLKYIFFGPSFILGTSNVCSFYKSSFTFVSFCHFFFFYFFVNVCSWRICLENGFICCSDQMSLCSLLGKNPSWFCRDLFTLTFIFTLVASAVLCCCSLESSACPVSSFIALFWGGKKRSHFLN